MKPRSFAWLSAMVSVGLLSACSPAPKASWATPDPKAETVQDIMKTRIDAAADGLWEAVSTIDTAEGEEVRRPRTDAEWAGLAEQAQRLIDGAMLLEAPRPISDAGKDLDDATTPGARNAAQVRDDIAKDPAAFTTNARRLAAVGRKTLAAIEARNLTTLLDATAELDAACETCHEAFWYPRTAPAKMPSEEALARTENRP